MTYENPYGENPDPVIERFERKKTENLYRKMEKKENQKLKIIPKASEMWKFLREKYLTK